MSKSEPRNIVLIVADSLRYDSVYRNGSLGVPYMEKNGTQFINASSPACWTLPATASIFTGELPHGHQATTQTRELSSDSVTLAQILKKQGYHTYQITSNIATSEIFGLDKGFDKVFKTWELAEKKGLRLSQLLVLLGKHRIRKRIFSKDAISYKLSSDIRAASVWFRSYYKLMFDHANKLMADHEKKGEKAFVFINLMETHFPYHIDSEFKFSSSNPLKKISELRTLFNIVNQTFLTKDSYKPSAEKLGKIKTRQSKAWDLIKGELDEFVRSLHENKENLVVFTSDHGENFGDQDWVYHFSNVTDACTRVPIFWMDHNGMVPSTLDHRTSSRLLFHTIAERAGYKNNNGHDIFANNVHNIPISQSYWYNHHARTLDKYRYNQFCFHYDGMRYLKKNGSWAAAETTAYNDGKNEMPFQTLDHGTNPIEEMVKDTEVKKYLNENLKNFLDFEKNIEDNK